MSKNKSDILIEKLRKRIKIDYLDPDVFNFKIAETIEEFQGAYKLVHDNYVKNGYIEPNEIGLRITIHNYLSSTITIIGKKNNDVISTLTIFQDDKFGLPVDSIYKYEVDKLRLEDSKIVEGGALAIHQSIPKNNLTILINIIKIATYYCRNILKANYFLIAINPKHVFFYEKILLFEKIGELKKYEYVNNIAYLYKLNIDTVKEKYKNAYRNIPIDKSLYGFLFEKEWDKIMR